MEYCPINFARRLLRRHISAAMPAILVFTITRYFFHHENDFSGFSDSKNLGKTPNSSIQERSRWSYIVYKGVAAILELDTFLPHIWNVY